MKSSVSVSTTQGSFSGGTSVKVPELTVSGRYLESADPSTTTVPRSATVFVEADSPAAFSCAVHAKANATAEPIENTSCFIPVETP